MADITVREALKFLWAKPEQPRFQLDTAGNVAQLDQLGQESASTLTVGTDCKNNIG